MSIKRYLDNHFSPSTAAKKLSHWKRFEEYLEQLNLSLQQVDYSIILHYLEHLQSKKQQPSSLNKHLVSIEQIIEGMQLLPDNPVRGLRVKRATEKALKEPIKVQELQQVLDNYPTNSPKQHRDKVILSLVQHQALRASELAALEVEHIDLEKAILFIPSIGKSKSRELLLQAQQIKLLDSYLQQSRPPLLAYPTNQLLLTGSQSKTLRNMLYFLLKRMRKHLPSLENLEHWRSSIIVHWLQHQPLLEVQEKLGHQFASSTERYQLQAVQSLQEALQKYHPLSGLNKVEGMNQMSSKTRFQE